MNRAFWRGRRVLVTGHTGFKGSWLCLLLTELGAQVTGYSLAPETVPNLFDQAGVAQGIKSVFGDVRDLPALDAVFREAQPEVVLHLAAQALVRRSYDDPAGTYGVNVMGTVNLLECVRACTSVRAAIVVTSDKCYENTEAAQPFAEQDRLGGHDPYSSSKACCELVCSAYRQSFLSTEFPTRAVGLATARAGNVIGGGDWSADRLVPDLLAAIDEGRPLVVRNPRATRPWQHVLEPLVGYLMLAERLHDEPQRWGGPWNFGPSENDVRDVQCVVETLSRLLGHTAPAAAAQQGQPHEAQNLALDSSKARALLGWSPQWDFITALTAIAEWHAAAGVGNTGPRDITVQQIARYLAALAAPALPPATPDPRRQSAHWLQPGLEQATVVEGVPS